MSNIITIKCGGDYPNRATHFHLLMLLRLETMKGSTRRKHFTPRYKLTAVACEHIKVGEPFTLCKTRQ